MVVNPKEQKHKVAIVIGHTENQPGACSPFGIDCEWQFNMEVAKHLGCVADVFTYGTYKRGYKAMVKALARKLNKFDYDFIIELHYNAASEKANGTECFYYFTNKQGKKIATEYCKEICNVFGTKNRKAKAMINNSQRGFWALYYPKATALLAEPFFGSNKIDSKLFKGNEKKYAEVIKKIIKKSSK